MSNWLLWPRTPANPHNYPWFVIAWRAPWMLCAWVTLYAAILICFFQLLMAPSRVRETWDRITGA